MNIEFGESIKKIIFINFFFVLFVKFEYWILFQLDYFVTIIHFFTSKQKTPFFCSIIVQKIVFIQIQLSTLQRNIKH